MTIKLFIFGDSYSKCFIRDKIKYNYEDKLIVVNHYRSSSSAKGLIKFNNSNLKYGTYIKNFIKTKVKNEDYVLFNFGDCDINYIGPFELEFVKCLDENKIYICELNSRFWMQNGIFNLNGRNIIIDRYLNIKNKYNKSDFKDVIWIYNSKINNTVSLKIKQILNKYKNTHRIVLSHGNILAI